MIGTRWTWPIAAALALGVGGEGWAEAESPPAARPAKTDTTAAEPARTAPPVSVSHEMVFHRALRSLMTDEAPEAVRITPEQQQTIAQIERERMEAFREFTLKHAEHLRELRTEIAEKRRAGDEEGAAKLMMELRTIEQARPNAEAYTKRVWDVLTEPQRIAVRNAVDDSEFESLQRRAQHRLNMTRTAPEGEGRVEMSEETFERVRAAVMAPTNETERDLSTVERMRARLRALPDRVLKRDQREKLAALLLKGEERGGRE